MRHVCMMSCVNMDNALLVAVVVLLTVNVQCGYVRIKTKVGEIIGFEDTWQGQQVNKFFGIPYAEAPVGERRFADPVAKVRFADAFQALKFGNVCPQKTEMLYGMWYQRETIRFNMSEDCLNLNIFAPEGDHLKPVMVWIHGGGYVSGTASQFDATKMAALGDAVVVTINFRLSVFGFYTTYDQTAVGNYALLDQQMALKWIQKNIKAFGGDKDRVTIFGSSTGSVFVTWHMLAPSNMGLFKRAIAQGGVVPMFWPIPDQANGKKYYREILPMRLGCGAGDSEKVLRCLRKLPTDAFQDPNSSAWPFSQDLNNKIVSGPIADGKFVPHWPHVRTPGKRLEDQQIFKEIDLLIGFNKYEGSPLLQAVLEALYAIHTNRSLYTDGITKAVFNESALYFGAVENENVLEALWRLYTTDNQTERIEPKRMLSFLGDALFVSRIMQYLKRRLSAGVKGATYMYNFLPKASKELGGLGAFLKTEHWIDGAIREDEVGYLLGNTADVGRELRLPRTHQVMSDTMIKLWTNFAKTGNPNEPVAVSDTVWPQYRLGEEKYLELDIKENNVDLRINASYRRHDMDYWLNVIPKLQRHNTVGNRTKEEPIESMENNSKADQTTKDEL